MGGEVAVALVVGAGIVAAALCKLGDNVSKLGDDVKSGLEPLQAFKPAVAQAGEALARLNRAAEHLPKRP